MRLSGMTIIPYLVGACLLATGCGLPKDASGTVERVRGGVLRVGVIHNPPFVIDTGTAVRGVEGTLADAIAQDLGARIEFRRGPEHVLMRALHTRELDLVIGGLDAKVPWVKEAALTRPYYTDEKAHVLAVPPGENAWLVKVERVLRQHEPRVGQLIAESAQ